MKLCIVLGTRPEIIKLSPLIKALQENKADFFVLHTGQHYSYELDKVFFDQLELPAPKYNLDAGSGSHAEETGKMLIGIEKLLKQEKPDAVIAEGDTNSVFAGALAAAKMGIRVGHVEAGLRSYDRTMPEEINRILSDHISDYLFAPTEKARKILLNEGIDKNKIFVTGNTIVDAVFQNLELAKKKVKTLDDLHLKAGEYFLTTLHRQENVDNAERFTAMLDGLNRVREKYGLPVIYPIHPRARKRLNEFNIKPQGLNIIEPIDYLGFLQLESSARLILTDSGGLQEEACILRVPCVTLRDNTERPETIDVGANVLAGADPAKILACAQDMLQKKKNWKNPFGDGTAGRKILEILERAG